MRARYHLRRALNRFLKQWRLQLTRLPDDYAHPDDLAPDSFARQISCIGIDFREQEQWRWLDESIASRRDEFLKWPVTSSDANIYKLGNEFFGPVDAEVYYAVLAQRRPRLIVEVGCGNSSRLARKAIAEQELDTRLVCIDPNPRANVDAVADEHIVRNVQALPMDFFEKLQPNDIFFIDSSHRLEIGGDLPFLYLEALPRLAPGVLVHIHDIHLPMQYPEDWIKAQERLYNEQFAVALMLGNNPQWEILWASQYLISRDPRRIENAFPNIARVREEIHDDPTIPAKPGSLWLRKM